MHDGRKQDWQIPVEKTKGTGEPVPFWLIPSPRYFAKLESGTYCNGASLAVAEAVWLKRITPLASEKNAR